MVKYVDVNALVIAYSGHTLDDDFTAGVNFVLDKLESMPAADVRPVVLCGNCKFWDKKRISCEGLARCLTGETGIRYRTANDYCSRGQKE